MKWEGRPLAQQLLLLYKCQKSGLYSNTLSRSFQNSQFHLHLLKEGKNRSFGDSSCRDMMSAFMGHHMRAVKAQWKSVYITKWAKGKPSLFDGKVVPHKEGQQPLAHFLFYHLEESLQNPSDRFRPIRRVLKCHLICLSYHVQSGKIHLSSSSLRWKQL